MIGLDPLVAFTFAGMFSPGPNIILLAASGARFGVRRTVPHIAGVVIGVGIIGAATGLGLGALILAAPGLRVVLRAIAFAWILWMAWAMLRAHRASGGEGRGRPFTLLEAALFQWVNPKVWAIALAASAGFADGRAPLAEAVRLGATFAAVNTFVVTFWTFAGALLAVMLTSPRAWSLFHQVMALLLAASAVMVLV